MRLVAIAAIVAFAATPVLAQDIYPDSSTTYDDTNTTTVAPENDYSQNMTQQNNSNFNGNEDSQTAAADQARQNYYRDQLDAANAQAQIDSAAADRDAALDRAAQDRVAQEDALDADQ